MPPQPPELFPSERPVRSDYALERSYARRRLATLAVLALTVGGVIYGVWGRSPPNPADIPTIRAEGSYKEKPADPGGIDIPHQDVQVYDELEGKNAPQPQIEHLLPPPETPQAVPHVVAAPPAPIAPVAAAPAPVPAPPPPPVQAKAAPPSLPAPAPVPKVDKADILNQPAPPPIATTATQSPPAAKKTAAAPVQEATDDPEPLTIDQVIKETAATPPPVSAPAPPPSPAPAISSGSAVIQLASSPDQGNAQAMMRNLQQKYASQLGDAILRLTTADLGSRGVFYRIQSQTLPEDEANQICSSLRKMNAGCILVRK